MIGRNLHIGSGWLRFFI